MRLSSNDDDMMEAILFAKGKTDDNASADDNKKGDNIAIDKIKIASHMEVKEHKRRDRIVELEATRDKALAKNERLRTSDGSNAAEVDTIKAELHEKFDAAKAYLDGAYKAGLDNAQTLLKKATDKAGVSSAVIDSVNCSKKLNQEAVGGFIAYVKRFNQTSSSMARSGVAGKAGGKTKAEPAPPEKSHVFVSLFETFHVSRSNCSTSVFEAKGGLRPAGLSIADESKFGKVRDAPVVKKALKSVNAAIKGGQQAVTQNLEAGAGVLKKFEETLVTAVGSEVRSKMALPRADWSKHIFVPEVMGTNGAYSNVFFNKFGMMSAYLFLSGDVALLGIPLNKVHGQSFADKRAAVMRYTVDAFQEAAKEENGGWYVFFEDGVAPDSNDCILVVPSGFIVVCAMRNAVMLRWPLVADQADTNRAGQSLRAMINSFPEYSAPGSVCRTLAETMGF